MRSARTRVQGFIKQVDAYAAGDYGQAYKIERQAYQSTFTAGATLAKASVTPKAAAALDAPRRSGCGRRLPCCWVSTWS